MSFFVTIFFFALALQTLSAMETRTRRVSEELKEQTELRHSTLQRAQLAEQQVQDLRERLHSVETELLTADKHIDGLRHNKQHVSKVIAAGANRRQFQVIARMNYLTKVMVNRFSFYISDHCFSTV